MMANEWACGHNAVSILGIPFDRLTVKDAIVCIQRMIESRKPHYVVTANVDFVVQARDDVELRRILIEAHLVLCDGTPLVWASKLLGNAMPERVAGSDLTPLLLNLAAEKFYKVFILGGTPQAASVAVGRILEKLPDLPLRHYAPPFHMLLDMDHDEIKHRIWEFKPDILLVSFGCPKQEKWIAMHYRDLGVPVSIGVGATIDFLAGQVRRAPLWMQKSGFEWMFRLSQEPKRLFGRYSRDMLVFGSSFVEQLLLMRNGNDKAKVRVGGDETRSAGASESGNAALPSTCRFLRLPENLDHNSVRTDAQLGALNEGVAHSLVLDARHVSVIDSTGLALLIRLNRESRSRERALVLLCPSPSLERVISFSRLEEFFLTADSLSEAQALVLEQEQDKNSFVTWRMVSNELRVWWKGEVTAANVSAYSEATCKLAGANQNSINAIRIDLTDVPFIDSTGLGALIRIRKFAARHELFFSISGMQPAVLNVVRLANLESVFISPPGVPRSFQSPITREKVEPSS